MKIREELGGKSKYKLIVFYWSRHRDLIHIRCLHVSYFCFGENEQFEKEMIKQPKTKVEVERCRKIEAS